MNVTADLRLRPDGTELAPTQQARDLLSGMPIFKNGRATGPAVGTTMNAEPSVTVSYDCGGDTRFNVTGQAVAANGVERPFAKYGDSGAFVIDKKARTVGGVVAVHNHQATYIAPWGMMKKDMMQTLQEAGWQVTQIDVL